MSHLRAKLHTMPRAQGPFDVELTPQPADDSPIGRMTIAKQFHGELEATSRGQMLAVRSAIEGSAGYVAIERVTGALAGKQGSFVLQHLGIVNRGAPQLSITVVPDSGEGGLAGLSGRMSIQITDGKHFYDFSYELAGPS